MSSTPYDRQTSFALYSAENPGEPHSGATLDAEFNAVKLAVDDVQQNLDLIQDADGALKRGSVGKEQFDSSVTIGFGAPSAWASGQIYTAEVDTVFYQSKFYIATVTHTSSVSFDATKWDLIADFTLAAVISDGSITSAKLADGAVSADKIADGSISNTKLATGAVSSNKIADANVTTAKIADANVTTAKIADANVTLPKLDPNLLPAGMIVPYAGTAAPTGWLLCYGQNVPRASYPSLFAAVGTAYGVGDGSTTFGLPDLRGRVPGGKDDMGGVAASRLTSSYFGTSAAVLNAAGGSESHTLSTAQMPVHNHGVTDPGHSHVETGSAVGGASNYISMPNNGSSGVSGNSNNSTAPSTTGITINNAGSGNAHNNVQPTLILNYIIKAH